LLALTGRGKKKINIPYLFFFKPPGTVIQLYIQEKYSYAMCSIGILGFVV
jgi:hypothetical protein